MEALQMEEKSKNKSLISTSSIHRTNMIPFPLSITEPERPPVDIAILPTAGDSSALSLE